MRFSFSLLALPTDYISLPAQARLCVLDDFNVQFHDSVAWMEAAITMVTEVLGAKELIAVIHVRLFSRSFSVNMFCCRTSLMTISRSCVSMKWMRSKLMANTLRWRMRTSSSTSTKEFRGQWPVALITLNWNDLFQTWWGWRDWRRRILLWWRRRGGGLADCLICSILIITLILLVLFLYFSYFFCFFLYMNCEPYGNISWLIVIHSIRRSLNSP